MIWRRLLKSILVDDKALYYEYHGSWHPGNARFYDIYSYGIDWTILEYSIATISKVKLVCGKVRKVFKLQINRLFLLYI